MPEEPAIQPFDLQRMFIGDAPELFILEIVFRTVFMYVTALLLVRFIGKRGLGQLSPFEYLIVISMGSATGDPMFYPEVPLVHGAVVLLVIVTLQKSLFKLTHKKGFVAAFVEGTPTLLVDHGLLLEDKLQQEGMSREEVFEKLREAGIENLGEVRYAYLEPSGRVSIFKLDPERQSRSTPILPHSI